MGAEIGANGPWELNPARAGAERSWVPDPRSWAGEGVTASSKRFQVVMVCPVVTDVVTTEDAVETTLGWAVVVEGGAETGTVATCAVDFFADDGSGFRGMKLLAVTFNPDGLVGVPTAAG